MTHAAEKRVWNGRYASVLEVCAYCLAFAVVVSLGMANLFLPFGPDQAIVYHGAKLISEGAVYYADYWDNKQPGLYWFYMIAGEIFGFSEFGIHLLELLWMLLFAVVAMASLRSAFRLPWLSALVPVATVGVYYGLASEHELTQLEFLVSFPIFCLVLCLVGAQRYPRVFAALYFVSGLFAGVAVVFKLLLAPLCVAIWLVALVHHYRTLGFGLVALTLRAVLPASAGVVLVLGSVVLLYAHWGHLDDLLWTAFVYPPQALESSPVASKTRLVTAAAFILSEFAPWLLFALLAVVWWVGRRRNLLGGLMLTWIAAAIVLFFVQRFSWWHYHTLLALFPAGFFAVLGIDRLSLWIGGSEYPQGGLRQTVVAAALALTATASLGDSLAKKAQPLLSSLYITGRGVHYYQSELGSPDRYDQLRRSANFLRKPDALPGPIYVFGNAMVYEFAGRSAAHRTGGSSWEFFLPQQVEELLTSLDREDAPYIFVGRNDKKLFRIRPVIARYIDEHYFHLHTDEGGSWFQRRDMPSTPAEPGREGS